ncbi:acido-empty-quinoprotein group A [Paludibaculum fermentans]|uniref:Acido-empty-quinoprotein group A n=1 Tax=Paludibaculum fermentans TaxID=1473598 RepID=A0A7S7NTC4_PALFE|nr:acido-empty-quinoprotein group A [Paludibaculum fermentans]QOY89353.1 acido-empty-quinoprotein group A [Paludibaculum fermentans]
MKLTKLVTQPLLGLAVVGSGLLSQAMEPAKVSGPPKDAWPMTIGDYSGRRFSTLAQINDANVNSLSLAWVYRTNSGSGFTSSIKATPVLVDGILYFSVPDKVWAVDARTGHEVWNFTWTSTGGIHIGSRGVAISGNSLYFETPDCHLVALNTKDGKERWRSSICDLDQMYFGSAAPLVINNHIIAGVSGDDLDTPGYIESHDPESGKLQWRWYAHPQPGEPEAKTWPSTEAMLHGGGMTWGAYAYDPELNLLYFGTGNPQPVIAGKGREGDNLYTESIIALNPDTGKLAWYFQVSPHDTHDWDGVEAPVLIDGEIDGKPRKLLAQASRNGYFFVLDRTNGKNILSKTFAKANWAKGLDAKGQPIPNPDKMPQIDGVLVSPNQAGAANWPPPSFSPLTGLFYVNATDAYSVYYIYDNDIKPEGWGGNDHGGWSQSALRAIDYKTGEIKWSHTWEGSGGPRSGVLSTAGNLVFAADSSSNFVALDAVKGQPLWHTNLGAGMSNSPMTYELDGTQFLVVAAGDTLFGFAMLAK